jgi:hypothetical protein
LKIKKKAAREYYLLQPPVHRLPFTLFKP